MSFLSISISHLLPQVGLGTKQKMLLNVSERKKDRGGEKKRRREGEGGKEERRSGREIGRD